MNRNKFNNKKLIILFVILFISIGFALLSTNLNIRGLLGFKDSKWDVHFDNIELINNDVESSIPVINETNTSIDFGGTFKEPGDVFEFSVDVVNSGTIDAMLNTVTKTGIDTANENYLNYTVTYDDNLEIKKYDLLKKDCRVRLKIKVEYKYDIENIPSLEQQSFSLSLEYVSSTNDAVDRGNTFVTNTDNNLIIVANAKENSMFDFKIYGHTEEKKYQGYQLIQKDGLSTLKNDTDFWDNTYLSTPLSDGWLNVTYDNTSGTADKYADFFIKSDYVNLKSSTKYTFLVEYRNKIGDGSIVLAQTAQETDPFSKNLSYLFDSVKGIKKGVIETKDDISGKLGLRSFIAINPGKKLSVDVRITLVEGDYSSKDLDYEPYISDVSNYDYAYKIHSLSLGDIDLTINNKNLLDLNKFDTNTTYGVTSTVNDDGSITFNGKAIAGIKLYISNSPIYLSKNKDYIQTIKVLGGSFTPYMSSKNWAILSYAFPDYNLALEQNKNNFQRVYTVYSTKNEIPFIWFGHDTTSGENDSLFDNYTIQIQIEEGNKATDYVKGKSKRYLISLGDIELNGIGDYKDYIHKINGKWYVHREIDKQVFTGEEEFILNDAVNGIYQYSTVPKSENKDNNSSTKYVLSDRFRGMQYSQSWNEDNTVVSCSDHFIRFNTSNATSVDEFKEYLKNNNTTVYYVLNAPKELEIKDQNLINQLNTLLENNLFEGYNYVSIYNYFNKYVEFEFNNK